MSPEHIDQTARQFARLSIAIAAGLAATEVLLLAGTAYWSLPLLTAVALGLLFTTATAALFAAVWRQTARRQPASLAKLYLATPVVKLVAAVAVILAYWALHRDTTAPEAQTANGNIGSRTLMLGFTAIFFSFYILQMIFESIYFSRVEKQNRI